MTTPHIFITGATGYIGGDLLFLLQQHHPEWTVSALVRSKEKGIRLQETFPNVRLVHGDLSCVELLEEESRKADIVFNCADCDNTIAATAIIKGLSSHSRAKPGWLIHTSGTGILFWEDKRAKTFGVERDGEYNDWDGINDVTSLPDDAIHRPVDKIVLAAGSANTNIKTAIVCPSSIYGQGRGIGGITSAASMLSNAVLKRGKGFLLGEGTNIWHQVHIQDLSKIYLALGEAAAASGGNATWGREGYYFAENGSFYWGDLQQAVAKTAYEQDLISSPEVDRISHAEVRQVNRFGLYIWGTNARCRAVRARKLLGWNPQMPSLVDMIPDMVQREASELGLIKGRHVSNL